mmetsp:Transcript_9742/g.26549  ORF Transcript_9742/g.26549 Transcript_9742/m.26549 type:complete len:151 (+) Transcript_9742:564-1016(+)
MGIVHDRLKTDVEPPARIRYGHEHGAETALPYEEHHLPRNESPGTESPMASNKGCGWICGNLLFFLHAMRREQLQREPAKGEFHLAWHAEDNSAVPYSGSMALSSTFYERCTSPPLLMSESTEYKMMPPSVSLVRSCRSQTSPADWRETI